MAIPNMAMIPSGYKPTKLYSVLPTPSYGSELVTNGDFATDSDWTKGSGWSISGGSANFDSSGQVSNSLLSQSFSQNIDGILNIDFSEGENSYTFNNGTKNFILNFSFSKTSGADRIRVITSGSVLYFSALNGDSLVGSIDNISVQEVLVSDADFDVSRASSATRVNAQGLIETPEFILSDDLVTNGDFSDGSNDWTANSGWSISGGKATSDGTPSDLIQTISGLPNNANYKVSFDVSDYVSGALTFRFVGVSAIVAAKSNGTKTIYLSSLTDDRIVFYSSSFIGSIDNVSVVEVEREDIPRLDYTDGGCPVLLTEPQSTNLITDSEDFTQWSSVSESVTSNDTISPDGTQSADTLSVNSSSTYLYESVTTSASTEYTFSFYVKRGTLAESSLKLAIYDASNASFIVSDVSYVASDSEWNRISQSFTTPVGCTSVRVYTFRNTSTTSGTLSFWGAQVEELSYATSYIPTYGAISTRASETINNSGDVNTFNSTEGTLFVEIAALANDGTDRVISLNSGSFSNRIQVNYTATSNQLSGIVQTNGTYSLNTTTILSDVTEIVKIAIKYKENDFAIWIDGVEVASSTSGNTPIGLNNLDFSISDVGNFYGKTSQIQVYNTALSDSELALLTGQGDNYDSYEAMRIALNYNIQ